jgi:hypothetical protein
MDNLLDQFIELSKEYSTVQAMNELIKFHGLEGVEKFYELAKKDWNNYSTAFIKFELELKNYKKSLEQKKEYKPKKRKNPLSIYNVSIVIVKGHPEIYCDGYLLLEDLEPEQVQKWYSEKIDRLPIKEISYESIKMLYPNADTYEFAKFIRYEKLGKFMVAVLKNEYNEVYLNDEYYLFLHEKNYQFKIPKICSERTPVLLYRNNKLVGIIMSITKNE